jgi:hypothetical protein
VRYTPKYIDRSRVYVVYDRDFETNAALSHTDIPLTLATREDAQEHCDRLNEVVRYEVAGKWYWEPKSGKRVKLTLEEAVDKGMWCWYDDAGTVCMGRPGGRAFDRKVIARCEAKTDD